jgi:AbrB family looped-hinge helix DNA binding protein
MSTTTLTSKGQTTIPKHVRKRLNLHPGDRLEFVIDEDGRVLLLPATPDVSELAGLLKRPAKPVTVAEMNQVIRKRGGDDDRDRHERARQTFGAG